MLKKHVKDWIVKIFCCDMSYFGVAFRDVTVYRLLSKGSVEEGIYRCAQNKLKLEQDVTGIAAKGKILRISRNKLEKGIGSAR